MDPSDLSNAAAGATLPSLLASFVAGYVVVLATPGPNILAVGGIAALHGLRGAVPLCAGAALGAGCLGATALFAAGMASAIPSFEGISRLAGGLLLGYVAIAIARQPAPREIKQGESAGRAIDGIAAFGAGFCTAATNPLTGSFFAAQFLGPLGPEHAGRAGAWAIACVIVVALLFFLGVASLLSQPSVRRAALIWHRPMRLGAAALLAFMAVNVLRPVVAKEQSCRAPRPRLEEQRPCREISAWPEASTYLQAIQFRRAAEQAIHP
ncbi:LysE family translocator [Roseomonas harenae]|uniref:LysE family translocator n=1 Tax=Muricoccus harenae TaxID=2692566 RepID=UPI001331BAD3|nr:LysE family transporter [Roseomonas harenae]